MKKNGEESFMFSILSFVFVALTIVFSIVFIYETGRTEVIDTIHDAAIEIENATGVSQAMQDHTDDIQDRYNALDIPYDLMFLYVFIVSVTFSIALAIQARRQSPGTFFGGLFFGLMGLLLAIFFIDQIVDWFFDQIFNKIFSDIVLDIPVIDWYFSNIGVISAIWFVSLLIINQMNVTLAGGRIEA